MKVLAPAKAFERSTRRRVGNELPDQWPHHASHATYASRAGHAPRARHARRAGHARHARRVRHAKSFTQEPLDPDKSERIHALAILPALSRAMDEMTQMHSQQSAVTVSRETTITLFRWNRRDSSSSMCRRFATGSFDPAPSLQSKFTPKLTCPVQFVPERPERTRLSLSATVFRTIRRHEAVARSCVRLRSEEFDLASSQLGRNPHKAIIGGELTVQSTDDRPHHCLFASNHVSRAT